MFVKNNVHNGLIGTVCYNWPMSAHVPIRTSV